MHVSPLATTVGVSIDSELRELFELFVEPRKTRPATYQAGTRSRRRVVTARASRIPEG